MKPPVEAPTSSAVMPARIDPERVEGRRELVAAAADIRLGRLDSDGRGRIDLVARLAIAAAAVAVADEHLAGQDKGLCLRSGVGQAAVHEELVETDLALPMRDGRAHRPIVAQAAARGLTAGHAPTVDQRMVGGQLP